MSRSLERRNHLETGGFFVLFYLLRADIVGGIGINFVEIVNDVMLLRILIGVIGS